MNGGGFGNVLGPLVQMLSHSSVEYSGAASRDRQDGRRYSKENTVEGATQGEGRAWSEQRPVFFHFSEGTPDIIKRECRLGYTQSNFNYFPAHTPSSFAMHFTSGRCEYFHFKQMQAYSLKG